MIALILHAPALIILLHVYFLYFFFPLVAFVIRQTILHRKHGTLLACLLKKLNGFEKGTHLPGSRRIRLRVNGG